MMLPLIAGSAFSKWFAVGPNNSSRCRPPCRAKEFDVQSRYSIIRSAGRKTREVGIEVTVIGANGVIVSDCVAATDSVASTQTSSPPGVCSERFWRQAALQCRCDSHVIAGERCGRSLDGGWQLID